MQKKVRRWRHQLTHLHIHIHCSRNVSFKFTTIQNFISSLFSIQFTSNFYTFYKFSLNLDNDLTNAVLFWFLPQQATPRIRETWRWPRRSTANSKTTATGFAISPRIHRKTSTGRIIRARRRHRTPGPWSTTPTGPKAVTIVTIIVSVSSVFFPN